MKRRMHNIFQRDGKAFVLAMDHSAQMDSPELKEPGKIIRECAAGGVDAFLTTYGIVRQFAADFGNAGIILRADGGSSTLRKPMSPLELLYSPEDAIRVGADAMLCMGLPGSQTNEHSLKYLARLAADCQRYNLPVCAEALPYGFEHPEGVDTRTAERMRFCCRQAADLGADFIKSEFVGGREFRQVVEHCYVPILVLGGGKAKTPEEMFAHIRAAMDSGAKGVIMGRNILRQENPPRVCAAIAAMIHNDASVEEALEILEEGREA